MKVYIRRKLIAIAGVAVSIALCRQATATVILYDSHGFESSAGYTAGNYLAGQPSVGGAANQWVQSVATSNNPPYPAAKVINYTASTQQLVGIADTNIGPNDYGYWYPGTYVTPQAAFAPTAGVTDHILVSWTEAYNAGATGNPFYGIDVYDGANSVALVGIDATNGLLVVQNPTSTQELGSSTFQGAAGTYYNFLADVNYSAKQYSVYVNGNLVDTEPFANAATQFTDADLLTYALGPDNANGSGYFDNYLVEAQANVPEPGSLVLGVMVSSLLIGRRRVKSVFR